MTDTYRNRKRDAAVVAGLVILVVAVFANSLTNEFVWDDIFYLLNVDAYRSFSFTRFFQAPGNGLEYLPIRDLSYALDFALWGENSTGFHGTNLVLYALNTVAVYYFTKTLVTAVQREYPGQQSPDPAVPAIWTAVFFTLLPIHCEAVNFIGTGRATLLASLFALLASRAFILFLGSNRSSLPLRPLAAALLWYVLAVLSKSTAVSLPLFLMALATVISRRSWQSRLTATVPFLAVALAVSVNGTSLAAKSGIISQELHGGLSLTSSIATSVQIPFFYLWKMLVPLKLSADYGTPFANSLTAPAAIAGMVAILVITAAAVILRTRRALLFVACSWYGITLIPVLRILPTSTVVADRYAYLPSYAFCLLLALLITSLSARWHKAVIAGAVVICLLLALQAHRQNRVWQSNVTLWQHTVAVSPRSVQARENLGTIYFFLHNYAGAFDLFAAVQQAEPLNPIYDFFAGKYYFEQQDFGRASSYFQLALEKKPDLIDALYFLGECCEQLHNRDCAIDYYWQTLASGNLDRARYKEQAKARLQALGAVGQ